MTRILVVHARGGIGDVILSTPVLEALHRGYPNPEITMLVRSGAADVVRYNPFVHDCIVVPEGEWDRGPAYRALVRQVRARHFEVGLVLWSKAPEAWLLALSGIPVRVGQSGRVLYSFLYNRQVDIASEQGDVDTHWSAIQLGYVSALGLAVTDVAPRVEVPDAARVGIEEWLPPGSRYVGFSVGKGLSLSPERWPVATFARLADAVARATQATIVLTGGSNETEIVAAVASHMQSASINLAGRTTLLQLAAAIGRCEAFVCPDSGPMHLAAAMGVPTVGIFAMRCEFPNRWRPTGPRTAMVRPHPVTCPIGCQKETCATFSCYQAVAPAQVVAAVQQVIAAQSTK